MIPGINSDVVNIRFATRRSWSLAAARSICAKKINLSKSLTSQAVGVKEVDDGIRVVSFTHYDLGYIDLEKKTLAAPR